VKVSYRRFYMLALAAILVISAGLGTGRDHRVTAHQNGTVIADSGFKPERDGFGFENYWSGDKPYTNLTAVEVHRMFGDQACQPGTESRPDCTLIPPAKKWMQTTNNEMDGGHCAGMAILSDLLYTKKAKLSDFGADSTYTIPFDQHSQREIAYWWATNAVPDKQDVYGKPSEIVDMLVEAFKDGSETYGIEIWKTPDSEDGHAVTPYAVEDMGDGINDILVYDNNFPGETGRITVDRNNETWKYNVSVNPGEAAEIWQGEGDDQTLFLTPNSPRLAVQNPPFTAQDASSSSGMSSALTKINGSAPAKSYNAVTLLSDTFTYADILFTDAQGHRFGYVGNKLYTEIPGALVMRLPNSANGNLEIEPIYYIPVGIQFSISLNAGGIKKQTINDVVMVGPGYDLALEGIKVNPGDTDTINFSPDGTRIAYTPSDAEAPNISLGVQRQGADYEFNILGSDVDKGGTIVVNLDYNKGEMMLHTTGSKNPATFDLTIDRFDNAVQDSYEHQGLSLNPTETVYIEFGKWDGKGDLSIGVDKQSDGSIDQTATESNQKH
jgi:hypothetical protein